jgi:hypothetical protein
VSLLAIVVVSDVGLVLGGGAYALIGVNVYGTGVRAVRRAAIWTLSSVVGLVDLLVSTLALALLLALVLAIVDLDRYGDVLVKRLGSVLLV